LSNSTCRKREINAISDYFGQHWCKILNETIRQTFPIAIFVALSCHLWHIVAMKWQELLKIIGREPVFNSSLFLAGNVDPAEIRRQLARWTKSGRLIQLRRCLYTFSEHYQKNPPHPFIIANQMKRASYVSLQSALSYYELIPEYVPAVTCVTTGRPETLANPFGVFIYKHIKKSFFFGYRLVELGNGQSAFLSTPEKALLDLLYLTPGSDSLNYLQELRLQNTDILNQDLLLEYAGQAESRKLIRAARKLVRLIRGLKER
jgi:predicted transcriptional regulator of viral defense system